jgi:hypothetical protein
MSMPKTLGQSFVRPEQAATHIVDGAVSYTTRAVLVRAGLENFCILAKNLPDAERRYHELRAKLTAAITTILQEAENCRCQ